MERPPRLLLLAAADAPSLAVALREGGAAAEAVVASVAAFSAALGRGGWDVAVASATAAPPEDALAAAAAAQPGLPVVVVAAAGADVAALAAAGAAAVLTAADARLVGAAVTRALRGASPASLPPADPSSDPASLMPLIAAASDTPILFSPDAGAAQALAEHLPIGLYQSTPDGRVLFANEALAPVLGLDSVEALGRIDLRSDLGYPRDHFVEQLRRHGVVRNLVVRWTDPTGRTKYTRENARAVYDAEGNVRYYEGTMEDVTAECEARERERQRADQLGAIVRFATAVDAATTAAAVHRAAIEAVAATMGTPLVMLLARRGDEARCVAWSEALPGDAVFDGLHLGALLPPHTQPVLLHDEQASTHPPLPGEAREAMRALGVRSIGSFPLVHHGRAHGAFVVLYAEPHAFTDEELRVAETLAWHVAGNLARQRAESDLRDSETCLRFLAENTAHVLYRLRYPAVPRADGGLALGEFDYLSPAVEALTGYTPDELAALGGLSVLIEEGEVLQGDGLPEAEGGGHYLALYRMRAKDGETRWVENNAYPWRDDAGNPVGLVGVLQDVTERKRHEAERAAEAARALCQQKALVELGGLHDVGPDAVVRRATELVAACTEVAQVGVWMEDAEGAAMRCFDLYRRADDAHAEEPQAPLDAIQPLLTELLKHRVIAVEEVAGSAVMERLGAAEYLRERGLRAVLMAPVRRHGRAAGIVALRHTAPRPWSAAEQDFAAAVADVVALAFERAEREAAEVARRESEARNRILSELASDYAFALHLDRDGVSRVAWATDAFARITGYDPTDYTFDDLIALLHPESRAEARAVLGGLQEGGDADLELRIVTRDGEDRWVRHRARRVSCEANGCAIVYHSGQDVTERKQFERELIAAREAAEEVARLKSAFLANMSHEIRTPLTGILGYAGLLAEEVAGEHREFVEFIEKSGRRLLDTLNSVLELARLEASGVEPSLELLDVGAEAHQAVRLLAPLAEEKGLALTLATPAAAEGEAVAALDRVCLSRILTNLIGNGIKFTDEGGVHVAVEVDGADVVVRVRDTGVGIAAEFLPHIFDEFKQESEGHARSHEGAGLGLAITRRLTDLLGGTISVESARPGGTTFTLAFPRHFGPPSGDGASAALPDAPPLARPVAGAPEPAPFLPVALHEDEAEFAGAPPTPSEPPAAEEPRDDASPVPSPEAPGADEGATEGAAEVEDPARGEAAAPPPAADAEWAPSAHGVYPDGAYPDAEEPEALPSDALVMEAWPTRPEPAVLLPSEAPSAAPHEAPAFAGAPAPRPSATLDPDTAMLDFTPLPSAERGGDAPFDPLTGDLDALAKAPTAAPAVEAPAEEESALVNVGPSVLVVEDNEDTRALLDRLLRRSYRVCAVADALSALDRMNRERFDALILDINLGGKQTGIDVLRIARTLPGYEGVFAVALTAYALPGDRERFLEAGFDRYVSKPFTRATLMEALNAGVPAA